MNFREFLKNKILGSTLNYSRLSGIGSYLIKTRFYNHCDENNTNIKTQLPAIIDTNNKIETVIRFVNQIISNYQQQIKNFNIEAANRFKDNNQDIRKISTEDNDPLMDHNLELRKMIDINRDERNSIIIDAYGVNTKGENYYVTSAVIDRFFSKVDSQHYYGCSYLQGNRTTSNCPTSISTKKPCYVAYVFFIDKNEIIEMTEDENEKEMLSNIFKNSNGVYIKALL